MAIKTERIEVRSDPESGAVIAQAASLVGDSVSAFMLAAARAAADRVLARSDRTLMPAEQFDEFMDSLDRADEAPQLEQLAQRERRFTRA